ncbi:ParA family protein, partial [Lacticaseibacillus paracasei]
MAKKILMYSMKGGIGKTTIQSMNAWNLAKDGHKVLAVDLDPQANLTNILFNTFGHKEPEKGLFDSFVSG